MAIELKVPDVGESITEVMVGEWLKKEGDFVEKGESIVIIETDKVNAEVEAPESGVIQEIRKGDGEDAEVGEVIGLLEAKDAADSGDSGDDAEDSESKGKKKSKKDSKKDDDEPDASDEDDSEDESKDDEDSKDGDSEDDEPRIMPAARRLMDEEGVDASAVEGTGPGGRILKEDVQRHLKERKDSAGAKKAEPAKSEKKDTKSQDRREPSLPSGSREEESVRMTPLRRRVASRLVEAQQTAALLTTFNEIDMSAVMGLRKQYQDRFVEAHGIKLGFMSFFVKAAVEALKHVPQVNAEVRGEEIVYRNYQDIGVAVGGGKGLVVPVIRNAERLSFAEIEKTIADLAQRAQKGKLELDELQGGTFTISNGGIYGSLLSTPIVNPPQSGILGMHKIEDRPIAKDGEVVIRPMMYVALTYDHRLVDGREAVTFLVKIKECIEDPTRILIEV